ncbi:peptidase inhibitor family I36 protein [Streptomyces sp. NPDC006995]|uniref:peptidase inhibitor family I36 protein n=1 Tax=unclassified Streptomyces TaxID=2593676 RepID=UPI0033C513EF
MLVLSGVLVLAMTSTAGAAVADPDPLQEEIEQVLARTQGGVQISRNEIAWDGGEVIMSFPDPGEAQAPVSSAAAQRLQAKVTGRSVGTVEPLQVSGGVSAQAADNCPTEIFGNDWYCFYQNSDFGGRRLQWNAAHKSPVYFSKYDFDNRTSSWSNKGGKKITVYEDFWVNNPTKLWTEYAHSKDSYVGYAVDNRADYFVTS